MEPTVMAGAARGLGSGAAAAVNRYRPVGVVRVQSAEDRAQAYRRFLDSLNGVQGAHTLIRSLITGGAGSADDLRILNERTVEMWSALDNVRLCAPTYVSKAAEIAVQAMQRMAGEQANVSAEGPDGEPGPAVWETRYMVLEAMRIDLKYHPRWWQWFRKQAEKKALRRVEGRKRLAEMCARDELETPSRVGRGDPG